MKTVVRCHSSFSMPLNLQRELYAKAVLISGGLGAVGSTSLLHRQRGVYCEVGLADFWPVAPSFTISIPSLAAEPVPHTELNSAFTDLSGSPGGGSPGTQELGEGRGLLEDSTVMGRRCFLFPACPLMLPWLQASLITSGWNMEKKPLEYPGCSCGEALV